MDHDRLFGLVIGTASVILTVTAVINHSLAIGAAGVCGAANSDGPPCVPYDRYLL